MSLGDLLLSHGSSVHEALASEVGEAYLQSLATRSLDQLVSEPLRLAQLSSQFDSDLANLCFRSYPTFSVAHECTTSLLSSLNKLDVSLNDFLEAAAGLSSSSKTFESSISPLMQERQKVSQVLEHVDRVGELLDLPRLVATCIRAGLWIEALDLADRTAHLHAQCGEQHVKAKEVMQHILSAVESEILSLKVKVLETLKDRSLKLPGAVKAIKLLRRMGAGSQTSEDEHLEFVLLSSRGDCFEFQISALQATFSFATDNPAGDERARFLKRYIEIWRKVIGDAYTMCFDIFLSGDASASSDALRLSKSKAKVDVFLHHALHHLSETVQTHIQYIQPISSLATISTQLTYCSTAFARFGFDFGPTVRTLIQSRVETIITTRFASAASALCTELTSTRARATLETLLLAPESSQKVLSLPLTPATPTPFSHQPPNQLTLFPPLARFVNEIASALNELRLLPLVALWPVLVRSLADALQKSTDRLLALVQASIPAVMSHFTPPVPTDEEPVDREARLRTEDEQRRIARAVVALWGRGALRWSDAALREGIYGDCPAVHQDERVVSMVENCEAILSTLEDPTTSEPVPAPEPEPVAVPEQTEEPGNESEQEHLDATTEEATEEPEAATL